MVKNINHKPNLSRKLKIVINHRSKNQIES